MKTLEHIPEISFEGSGSKTPLAFKYYDPEMMILGKTMREHLKFAMSYWHTINAGGTDMFGGDTMDKTFGKEGIERYKAKADFAFELMRKLHIDYFCFHDVDIAPEGASLGESIKKYIIMVDYIEELMKKFDKKCLWNTANMFGDKLFMAGAATSPNADIYAVSAAKVKVGLDVAKRLDAGGYVFWGGREGYDTLINTDMGLELDNLGRFLHMAADYADKIGFTGALYIEPKPKEPTKHQYDYDVATCMNFLRKIGLENRYKMNIEANHATLAGHTFQHELRTAVINGSFGSVDANQGDLFLGWDTDQFPTNVYDTALAMYEIIKAGGFTTGGLNFDAKARRQSNAIEDIFLSYIAGMDTFALGLKVAAKIIEDGRIDSFVEDRYAGYNRGIGRKIVEGKTDFDELYNYALTLKEIQVESGKQEYLESLINNIMFS
ncbi:MAG: xylose isomerase [Spirochaetales bacterium]|nr:xylose isomerase [Spirochaetales bacterium]